MGIFQRVVVPVATGSDAEETAAALAPHLGEVESVVAVHVVEKAGGGIDKAPLEKRKRDAEEALAAFERALEGVPVDTEVAYGTDVVDTLFEVAEAEDATAMCFVAREGGRLIRLLSGDTSLRLVTEGTIPVVALPSEDG